MELFTLGARSWKLADIAADPRGWIVVAQDEADGALVLVQLTPEGARRVPDVRLLAGGGNAFPVLWVDHQAHTWLAYRHDVIGGVLLNLTTAFEHWFGFVYGNAPIAFGFDWIAYQRSPVYHVTVASLRSGEIVELGPVGRPTGLAFVGDGGVPVLVDETLGQVRGMARWTRVGRCTVGENADNGLDRNIARLDDGREAVIWPGQVSYTPRIATDGGTYAIVTWGDQGVRLALLTDRDFRLPPEPRPDIPFVALPGASLLDTLPYVLGAAPALAPGSTAERGEVYIPKNRPPESETWRWDRATGWITHAWDQSRYPGDPGWFWWPDDRWCPLGPVRTGDTIDVETQLYERRSLHDPARRDSYTLSPFVAQIRIEVGHGRYAGHDVELVLVRDNRKGPRPAPAKGRLGRQERFLFSLVAGPVRFESLKDNPETGVPEIEFAVNEWTRQAAYAPCPRPAWAPAWTPPPHPDPEPDPMPVNAIPQDVTARSLAELRRFAREYEYHGAKPYEADVTDDEIVDGLVLFLLETWMPVMAAPPNPGSLEGWERRRAQADAALQAYMRRRVGDVPESGAHPWPLVAPVTTQGDAGFIDGDA